MNDFAKNRLILLYIIIIIVIIFLILYFYSNSYKLWDHGHIISANPSRIYYPRNKEDIIYIVSSFKPTEDKISVAGAKYSSGGHTMINDGIVIDLYYLNKIIDINKDDKTITVEAGITWREIIEEIDRYDLSVSEMQSYCNFSVGGAISVNCHGRGNIYGSISDSILEIKIINYEGKILTCSREERYDLFQAAIGGYGGLGIIIEAKLRLEDNYPIRRYVTSTSVENSAKNILRIVKDKDVVFHNTNIYPHSIDKAVHITWKKYNIKYDSCEDEDRTDPIDRIDKNTAITNIDRIQEKKDIYWSTLLTEQVLRRVPLSKTLRAYYEPKMLEKEKIVMKNWEMSYDVKAHEPLIKYPTTTILQEYFIDPKYLDDFLMFMWKIFDKYNVNVLNVSLRYVAPITIPILNYSSNKESIAIVLYINIINTTNLSLFEKWTQPLIDKALNYNGSYYLPYLPLATKEQFRKAYNYKQFLEIKRQYDPHFRFSNLFLEKYLLSD